MQEIEHIDQPLISINLFLNVLSKVRKVIKDASMSLDLKVTAWLAGFPINNAEFVVGAQRKKRPDFPGSDDHNYSHYVHLERFYEDPLPHEMLDFIGPQMDLGFRLASLSSPRKMVLSLDLTWMLINTFSKSGNKWPSMVDLSGRIRFEGSVALKGVLSGAPYPVFWFDVKPDHMLNTAEDGVNQIVSIPLSSITEYCNRIFEHYSATWLDQPFVCIDEEQDLKQNYRERLKGLRSRLRKYAEKYKREKEDLTKNPPDGKKPSQEEMKHLTTLIIQSSKDA